MVNLPSVRHLRHLLALYECGHFGRAAEACRVTQSTLSASIKELEAVLEATLVDRTKRQVVLTPVGIETVERARRIMKDIEDLVSFTASAREPLSGALRMGAIPTVGPFLLPRVLPGLRDSYGRLKLYLVEDLTERLVDSLHRGQLDVLLLALPYDCGAVETAILFEDPFVVCLPSNHPLTNGGAVKPRRLWDADLLLLKDGHCLRDHALSACHLADRRRTEGFEATSLTYACADGRQWARHHVVALASRRGRPFARDQSRHPPAPCQGAGAQNWSRLAPWHGASRRVSVAR
jgi:LysR family transcriptional regulator, hydrogen peroxide-inducible genes activator